jgi:hypothetical protein
MVPILWIARKPDWKRWMATGIPDHPSGFREPDLAVLLGIALKRMTIEHLMLALVVAAAVAPR